MHLEPQVFDLLRLLVENPGTLLSKDHLIENVWQGLNVSDATVSARIAAARKAVGDTGQTQAIIRTVHMRGIQLIAEVTRRGSGPERDANSDAPNKTLRQSTCYVSSSKGAKIAYSATGTGPPLMRIGHWLSHLELDWHSPVWRPLINALSETNTLYRYDQRGTGLSSGDLTDTGLDDFVDDLTAVANAAGLDRFPIFAASQAVPVAVRFAERYPERVIGMALYGGFVDGRALRPRKLGDISEDTALALVRAGWGKPDSPFAMAFSTLFAPDATTEQLADLVQMQLRSVSADGAATLRKLVDRFSIAQELQSIRVPTLVIHAEGDAIQPLDQGRRLASEIPNARYVQLASRNHIPLPQEASWTRLLDEVLEFIRGLDD